MEVWPENLQAWRLWSLVGDQFRMGSGGPVALDLVPVFHELDRMDLQREDYDSLLQDMKAMAGAAIQEINSRAD